MRMKFVDFLFVGHDAPFDLQLLFQAGELALDYSASFGRYASSSAFSRSFACNFIWAATFSSCCGFVHRVVESAGHQRCSQRQRSQQLSHPSIRQESWSIRLYDFAFSQVSVN